MSFGGRILKFIVTGGAGFIGGNYIHYHLKAYPEDRVICVDKLTYAGNLSTLAPVMDNPKFRFVKLDICDREEDHSMVSGQPFLVRRDHQWRVSELL